MPIDLDELERLEREATPGPWKIDDPDGDRDWMNTVPESARYDFRRYYEIEMRRTDSPTGRFYMSVPTSFDDAYFIAATRNALPDLLAELRTLRARVAEMERDARLGQAVREAAEQTGDITDVEVLRDDDLCRGGYLGTIVVTECQFDVLRAIGSALREEEGEEAPNA